MCLGLPGKLQRPLVGLLALERQQMLAVVAAICQLLESRKAQTLLLSVPVDQRLNVLLV